jgi:hypothetical protein
VQKSKENCPFFAPGSNLILKTIPSGDFFSHVGKLSKICGFSNPAMDPSSLTSMATYMYLDIVNSLEMEAIIISTIIQLVLMLSKMNFKHKSKYIQKTKRRYQREKTISKSRHSRVDEIQGPPSLKGIT